LPLTSNTKDARPRAQADEQQVPVPPDPQGEGGLGQEGAAPRQGGQEGQEGAEAGDQGGQEGADARGHQELSLDRALDAGRPH